MHNGEVEAPDSVGVKKLMLTASNESEDDRSLRRVVAPSLDSEDSTFGIFANRWAQPVQVLDDPVQMRIKYQKQVRFWSRRAGVVSVLQIV
jgi:hypothetical protein